MKVSKRRASFGARYLLTSKPLTSPAICEGYGEGSKRVMRPMPDLPARMLPHASAIPMPTGEMIPRPDTTTLRFAKSAPPPARVLRLAVRLDVIDRLLDRGDLLGLLVRYLGLELFLERHDELHGIERVRAEVVHEGRFVLHVGFVHAELLGNNLFDPLLDVL